MLHAKPGASLRTRALPVLLMSATAAAFGGLVALAPAQPDRPVVLAYADAAPLVLEEPAARERAQARASRDRRLDEQARTAATKAAAGAAADQAAATAKAAAQAKAKAKADAQAAAQAKARKRAKAGARFGSPRIAGRCPVPNATFTDTWGAPRSGGRAHKGTDMLAPYGSPVYAVADGRIRAAYSSNGGISLYLDADNGETYFYAHNSQNLVRGGRVAAGQLIARVGSTGNAGNVNHVHFEREVGGRSVNPYPFVSRLC